jgi:hypothetical protein
MDEIQRVFAKAQRANVTIHAIDPGGLSGFASAVVDAKARSASNTANARQLELWQDVLGAISSSTGGRLPAMAPSPQRVSLTTETADSD